MSAQDRTEQVLRDIHILLAQSEVYDKATNRVIVDKKEILDLLQRLNVCIYELMEDYEMTQRSRDAAEREVRKKTEGIVRDANRMAEDVYAGSVLYTDEALRRVQEIMQEAADSMKDVFQKVSTEMDEQKARVHRNQSELKSYLEGLHDTNKYLQLIEDRNREIAKEKAKKEKEEEPSVHVGIKPEIKVNTEYFEKAGIPLTEEETKELPEENQKPVPAEIRVNLDAEYFKWKEENGENARTEKKTEKHSLLGKILK